MLEEYSNRGIRYMYKHKVTDCNCSYTEYCMEGGSHRPQNFKTVNL